MKTRAIFKFHWGGRRNETIFKVVKELDYDLGASGTSPLSAMKHTKLFEVRYTIYSTYLFTEIPEEEGLNVENAGG